MVSGAEDIVRVIERDASRFGHLKVATASFKQSVTQRRFECLDLRGNRALRDVERVRGTGQGAFTSDSSEEAKVVKVQVCHCSII